MNPTASIIVARDSAGRPTAVTGPGLVDLQVNGYGGLDFNGPLESITLPDLRRVLERIRRRGVTAILATFTTDAAALMAGRMARFAELRRQDELVAEMIPGFHVEGPLISPNDGPRGDHPKAHTLAPAQHPGLLDRFQQASGGLVRILTLAPELPGAIEMIRKASAAGVTIALGHHEASGQVIAEAVAAGARMCTHLGNGSHATLPRMDNYIQRQLADDRLHASFIADAYHVPLPALKNFIRAKGTTRSVIVTDAIHPADALPGEFEMDPRWELSPDGAAVLMKGTPYLCGSALPLDRAILNVVRHCDVPLETAWAMASVQPARLVGLPDPPRISVSVGEQGFVRQ